MLDGDDLTAVEGDADDIEADRLALRGIGAFGQPGGGEAADPLLLAAVDGEDGPLGTDRGPAAARFDLDEDERVAVAGDDVELTVAGAGVALEDLPTAVVEVASNQLLGFATHVLTGDSHRSTPKTAVVTDSPPFRH